MLVGVNHAVTETDSPPFSTRAGGDLIWNTPSVEVFVSSAPLQSTSSVPALRIVTEISAVAPSATRPKSTRVGKMSRSPLLPSPVSSTMTGLQPGHTSKRSCAEPSPSRMGWNAIGICRSSPGSSSSSPLASDDENWSMSLPSMVKRSGAATFVVFTAVTL